MDIDTSKPNPGRIYDYLLGGHHNFEADRAAAEHLLTMLPSAQNAARLNRWFMHDAVQRLAEHGYDCYLDLATGLPTQGYIHDLVPQARVLYNDVDPVTVQYGREIVGHNPNVRYVQANFNDIDTILKIAEEHFGSQRRIAVCFIGSTYFTDDDNLRRILDRLYAWCAPGSRIATSWIIANVTESEGAQVGDMYRRMNSAGYARSLETVQTLLTKWQIDDPGLIRLPEWLAVDNWRSENADVVAFELYGAILTKA